MSDDTGVVRATEDPVLLAMRQYCEDNGLVQRYFIDNAITQRLTDAGMDVEDLAQQRKKKLEESGGDGE